MGNRIYHFKGNWQTREVSVDGQILSPRPSKKIVNHSPDGFCWGYSGSGPAQLALAICLKILGREMAIQIYQGFKSQVIAILPKEDFDIEIWIAENGKLDWRETIKVDIPMRGGFNDK